MLSAGFNPRTILVWNLAHRQKETVAAQVSAPVDSLVRRAVVPAASAPVLRATAAETIYTFSKTVATNKSIPDGPTGAWVGWDIDARSLPAGAIVTSIQLRHKVVHRRIGDLEAKLYDDTGKTWMVRDNVGGTTRNFDQTTTDATVFLNSSAPQTWHYRIRDTVGGTTGYLDHLVLTISYKTPAAIAPQIVGQSISTTTARDGQTVTLGYQIAAAAATTATLDATLTGPSGEILGDAVRAVAVPVAAGTNWYYRTFAVNLPPQAQTGLYDVAWKIRGSGFSEVAVVQNDSLTIAAPLAVRVPMLMYHHIDPLGQFSNSVSTAEFRAHLEALKAYGYTPITLQDLLDYRSGTATPPAKPVLISFDDGWESLYTHAYPILADPALQFKATAFIATANTNEIANYGGGDPDQTYLAWSEILALHQSGLIDVQSHTVTHPELTKLSSSQLAAELIDSKQTLESRLQKEVRYISWPFGDYNATVAQAGWNAGYFAGVAAWGGVEPSAADKWNMARVGVDRYTSVDFDPSRPNSFLFSMIGESSVAVPLVAVDSVQYLDAATGQALSQVQAGQQVRVRVTATNTGPAAQVAVGLRLGTGSNASTVVYDSHAAAPGEDVRRLFGPGTQTFEWTWQAPSTVAAGQYYAAVKFRDDLGVLGFADTGWTSAFRVR